MAVTTSVTEGAPRLCGGSCCTWANWMMMTEVVMQPPPTRMGEEGICTVRVHRGSVTCVLSMYLGLKDGFRQICHFFQTYPSPD